MWWSAVAPRPSWTRSRPGWSNAPAGRWSGSPPTWPNRTRMAEAGGGRIVTIASVAGLRALREHYSYCASKAALIMAT